MIETRSAAVSRCCSRSTYIVELDELALVNGTDTQLTLDGRDQRRALEEGTSQSCIASQNTFGSCNGVS